jgi:hypothetical protein
MFAVVVEGLAGSSVDVVDAALAAAKRRFDALHRIFLDSVTAPANGKRPEPLVNFIIDATTALETLARHRLVDLDTTDAVSDGPVDPATRRCATSTGTPVHPDVVLRAMLHGRVRRVIVDANDVVINMGRTRRLFTGNARRAAQLLTVTCTHRGCDIPAASCDIDHNNEWASHTGGTDQHNAMALCGVHDRWKHQQQLTGRSDTTGRIHLTTPNDTTITPLNTHDPHWPEVDQPPPATTSAASWQALTAAEWTDEHPHLRRRPDPSWTLRLADFPAAEPPSRRAAEQRRSPLPTISDRSKCQIGRLPVARRVDPSSV